jgi:glucose-1-phosphate cytidylyltransferase
MKVLILAGGLGSRLSEETTIKPKPMVEIGGKPIIWHIMKTYAHYGYTDFVILIGYKGDLLKQYFNAIIEPGWHVELLETGVGTLKSKRIKMAEHLVQDNYFFVAYGDDVSDISPGEVLETHLKSCKIATLTAIPLVTDFGIVELNNKREVKHFREKPRIENHWINGGYFCFSHEIFDYLGNEDEELEDEVFSLLAAEKQIGAHIHEGFWKCMNTYKDKLELDLLIAQKKAPWVKWE